MIKKAGDLDARVNDLELGSQRWLAATTQGIYSSTDQGKTWKGGPVMGQKDFVSVRAQGSVHGGNHAFGRDRLE